MADSSGTDCPLVISLVVCTRNRAQYLPQMLNSLTRLTMPKERWELVIVNNGSVDNTAAILKTFAESFAGNLKVIDEARPGLSVARNTGWALARGKYLAFTDDDCYPAPDFLEAIVHSFETHEADYVGGRVLLHDPADAPVTIQLREDKVVLDPASFIEAGIIHGANLCIKRSVLKSLNGFDTLFGAGGLLRSGEDTDLMMRASADGFLGVYDPALVVSHHHRRRLKADVDSLYRGYAYGRGALVAKALTSKMTRRLYLKHFYWRLNAFIRDRQWSELTGELRGFVDYAFARLFKVTPFKI